MAKILGVFLLFVLVARGQEYPQLPSIPTNFDVQSELINFPPALGAAPDVVGAFRLNCNPSHLSYDDPILYPGQPGKSYLQQWYGNTLADGYSTYESLRKTGNSTCNNPLDRSAYWMPAMMNGKGGVVRPDYISVEYKRSPKSSPSCFEIAEKGCINLPRGLRYTFGYDLVTATNSDKSFWFNCHGGENSTGGHFNDIIEAGKNCVNGSSLGVVISSPSCWDGKNLDSPNHRSHMAYPSYNNNGELLCPKTHPWLIPTFNLGAWFKIDSDFNLSGEWNGTPEEGWHLSSDIPADGSPMLRPGSTFYSDWFGAFDDDIMQMWSDNCIDKLLSCSSGDLGNEKGLKMFSGFKWAAEPRVVPVPTDPKLFQGVIDGISESTQPESIFAKLNDLAKVLYLSNVTTPLTSSNGVSLSVASYNDPRYGAVSFSNDLRNELNIVEDAFIMTQSFPQKLSGSIFVTNDGASSLPATRVVGVTINNGRDGKEILITNLSNPIEILIPYESLDSSLVYDCIWWNEQNGTWDVEGCNYVRGEAKASCLCNHLTNFSLAQPPKIGSPNKNYNALIGGIVGGVGGLLLIGMIVGLVVIMKQKKSGIRKVQSKIIEVEIEKDLETIRMNLERKEQIGIGEYGNTYKGIYSSTLVLVQPLEKMEKKVQFMNECNILKRLHHPNISQFLGLVESEVAPKMSMIIEYPPIVLSEFIQVERPMRVLLSIAKDISSALKYLSQNNIVHGNVQIGSVIVRELEDEDEFVGKLANFSLVTNESGAIKHSYPVRCSAPEVLRGDTPTHKSDIFSFGLFLFQLMNNGKLPLDELNDKQWVQAVKKDKITLQYPFHQEVEILINKCCDKLENRPSADQICESLSAIAFSFAPKKAIETKKIEGNERSNYESLYQPNNERKNYSPL